MEFERIAPMLYTICANYARKMDYKYSRDELINAVWAQGKVEKITNPKYLSRRIAHDCVEYIRQQEGWRLKHKVKFTSLDDTPWFAERKAITNGTKAVIEEDTWKFLLKGLSRTDQLIARCLGEGCTFREAGKAAGMMPNTALKRAQQRIRPHLIERLGLLAKDVR